MIIGQISDTHISASPISGSDRMRDLERVISDINKHRQQPDLVIHTGDASNSGKKDEYILVRQLMEKLKTCWIILPGNRDNGKNMHEVFGHLPWMPGENAPLDYLLEELPLRIIAFDSTAAKTNKGYADHMRLVKLSGMLKKGAGRPAVLAMHHPPFAMRNAKDPHQFADWSHAKNLTAALHRHPCVKLLLCGHSHRLAESHIGKAPAFTMPSVATDLRKGEFKAALARHPAYMLYELDQTGKLLHHQLRIVD